MTTRNLIFQKLETADSLPEIVSEKGRFSDLLRWHYELDLNELAEWLEYEPELHSIFMTQVRKMVPSDSFSAKDSIVYIGLKSARNIIAFSIINLFYANPYRKRWIFDIDQYWHHVLGTAVACEMICKRIGCGNSHEIFSYGLLHDIGILVIDCCLPSELDRICQLCRSGTHMTIAEKIVLNGLTHGDVGVWICEKWELPTEIANAIRYHHYPLLCKSPSVELMILYAADVISTRYYHALLGGLNSRSQAADPRVLRYIGITEDDLLEIGMALPRHVNSLRETFLVKNDAKAVTA